MEDPLALGDRLRREGRTEDALARYRQARDQRPADALVHLRYVSLLVGQGRGSEARSEYASRAGAPQATVADRVLFERLATDGSSSALRGVYERARSREPHNPWWSLALAEVELAEADAWGSRREAALARGDREEAGSAAAQAHAALSRADQAVARAGQAAPGRAEVDLYRGLVRAVEGDLFSQRPEREAAWRAAEDSFARALSRDPRLVEAWEGLADVRLRTGDVEGSLTAWLAAVEQAPADAGLRMALGGALLELDRADDAARQYEEATRLRPQDAEPWLRLGDARAQGERWELALEAYAEALVREGGSVEAHFRRGAVFEHLGRAGEALESYERYLSQGGRDAATARRRLERLLRDPP